MIPGLLGPASEEHVRPLFGPLVLLCLMASEDRHAGTRNGVVVGPGMQRPAMRDGKHSVRARLLDLLRFTRGLRATRLDHPSASLDNT